MTTQEDLPARAQGLLVFHGLVEETPFRELWRLAHVLRSGEAAALLAAYGALFRWLMEPYRPSPQVAGALPQENRLREALQFHDNVLARWVQVNGRDVPSALAMAARADLRVLQELVAVGAAAPRTVAAAIGSPSPLPWPSTSELDGAARWSDWGDLLPQLIEFYAANGAGPLARYRTFRWEGSERGLVPVPVPDAVRPDDLIGYEAERALLRQNTAQFAAGFPANNVLLYGDRGTGKSSSVKSLLHYQGEGAGHLRLIEVPKALLGDFPTIAAALRGRRQRFILFVDDLSFEEGETEYKAMKAVLEGGLEARPENVVVYATSNRRHLIREQFSDRTTPDSQEVHAQDTVQEKLSFADRFGLTITFPSPSQTAYLTIVEGLARQRGLTIEPAALRARAIEWAAWHNGRSGRTARQFVDHLTGELGLTAGQARPAHG